MKNITLLLTAVLLFAGISGFAQKKGPENRAKALTDSLKIQLSLTDEQYAKVESINLEFVNKMKEMKDSGGDKKAKRTEMKGWAEERDNSLQKVLTTEQFATYKANKQARREAMKGNHKKRPGARVR